MTVCLLVVCVHRGLTGRGRTLRWDVTARGGETGTTTRQSKRMHHDPVGPEPQGLRITGVTGTIPFLLCVSQPCEAVL